jgi:hypothetical protein
MPPHGSRIDDQEPPNLPEIILAVAAGPCCLDAHSAC